MADSRKDFSQYRILCMNCNFAHGVYDHCPHDLEKGFLCS